jgi:hypothetical protein
MRDGGSSKQHAHGRCHDADVLTARFNKKLERDDD